MAKIISPIVFPKTSQSQQLMLDEVVSKANFTILSDVLAL